jgi:hypothetical protein
MTGIPSESRSLMWWRHRGLILGIALLVAMILLIVRYFDDSDVAHQAIQVWLRLYGDAIYEYQSITGKSPSKIDDLGRTKLPQRLRYWKQMLDDGTIVIVWHKNLKPDPKVNAGLILAYHNKGLYAQLGRVWVCWGDLRTEYIKREDLQAGLPPKEH